jgi:hypothetical protein
MSRFDGLTRWLPWPFVGVALLLATLIFLTPVLIASSQPPAAGSLFTQAELIVDGISTNSTLHFYVRGEGISARYTNISIGFAFNVNWSDPFGSAPLRWTDWSNASNVLSIGTESDRQPVAVNASALYVAGGASALYVGVLAFNVTWPPAVTTPQLNMVSNTSGISPFTSYSFLRLPIAIPLANIGSGGST